MKKLVKYGILPLSVLALSVALPQTTSVVHAEELSPVDKLLAERLKDGNIPLEVVSESHKIVDGKDSYDMLDVEEFAIPLAGTTGFSYSVKDYPEYEVEAIYHIGGLTDDNNPDPKIIEYSREQLEPGYQHGFDKLPHLRIVYKEKAETPQDPASGGNAENGGGTNENGGTGSPATENPNPTNSNNDSNNNSNASNTAGGGQGDNVNTNNTPTNSTTEVPDGEPLRLAVNYLDLSIPTGKTYATIPNTNAEYFLKPGESITIDAKEYEGYKFEYAKLIGTDKIKAGIVNLPFTISYNDLNEKDGGIYNALLLHYSKIEKPSEEPKKPDVNPDLNGNNNTSHPSNNSNNSSGGGQTQTPPANTGGSNNSNNSNQLNNTNSSSTGSNISLNTGRKPPKTIIPGKKVLDTSKNNDSKMTSASKTQNQGSELSQADVKNQDQAQASAKVTPKVEAEQTQAKATEKTVKTLPNTGESMPFLSVFVGIFSIFCLAWAELKHKQ